MMDMVLLILLAATSEKWAMKDFIKILKGILKLKFLKPQN